MGGHNLLEPAAVGVPVLFGPHTDHVAEIAATLEQRGAGLRASDSLDLGEQVTRLLGDAERRRDIVCRAQAVLEENRGALDRTVSLLLAALERATSGRFSTGVA